MSDLTELSRAQRLTAADSPDRTRQIQNPEEAAKQFEKILLKQFVREMTGNLMQSPLSGEDGPGWMETQRSHQQDAFGDMLAEELAESESFNISKLLIEQWREGGLIDEKE